MCPTRSLVALLLLSLTLLGDAAMSATEAGKAPVMGNQAFLISDKESPKLQREALTGSAKSAFRLYQHYAFAVNDMSEGLYWLVIASENGHAIAQQNYAYHLMQEQTARSRQRARFWIRESAKRGNKAALELLDEIKD